MFAREILNSKVSDKEKVQLLKHPDTHARFWLFMALHKSELEEIKIFVDAVLASSLPLASKQELLAAKIDDQGYYSWFKYMKTSPGSYDCTHAYVMMLYQSAQFQAGQFYFADAELQLLQGMAEQALNATKTITWETVHWIGLAYKPGLFHNHERHLALARQMQVQEARSDAAGVMGYLHHIYHQELESKKTSLAQNIELVFANTGNLEALLSSRDTLSLPVNEPADAIAASSFKRGVWDVIASIARPYLSKDADAGFTLRIARDMQARAAAKQGDPIQYLQWLAAFLQDKSSVFRSDIATILERQQQRAALVFGPGTDHELRDASSWSKQPEAAK